MTRLLLAPTRLGRLGLPNRLVRAATSETMADAEGFVTPAIEGLYGDLARGGAGLIITGHIYVERRGQYAPNQTGLDEDAKIAGWRRLVDLVHREGGRILAELSHAGSQSVVAGNVAVAPSPVPNAIFGNRPDELTSDGIAAVAGRFGQAAGRAMEAGFDGIHIHGGNGYLVAQFASPLTNRRTDPWGGDAESRGRFLREVYAAVRAAVGPGVPVTARVGMADAEPGGLALDEAVPRVLALERAGLDGVEPTYAIMNSYLDNIRPYVGVSPAHALRDWALGRFAHRPAPEAYYRPFARALKEAGLRIPVILVGGLRSTAVMEEVLASGDADLLALARPFVREPDLPRRIAAGRTGAVDCVSCNLCLLHEGRHGLRCWRKTTPRLLRHVWLRYLRGS